jgi:hypothetical protein
LNRINDLISKRFLAGSCRFTNHRLASVPGVALGGGLCESAFSIRIAKGVKPLISLNRFGQLLAVNGQLWVLPGQKPVAILVKL